MKKIIIGLILLTLAARSIVTAASLPTSDEHIVWQRAPISVVLPVGQERFVTFPSTVQFGYDKHKLPPYLLRVENDDRTLYLTASKTFATERVEAKLAGGEIILLDLSAKANADDKPLDIVLPQRVTRNTSINNHNVGTTSSTYVGLTRFAVQELYAPKRLLHSTMSITRFPMDSPHIVPLFYDGSIAAMPLASWRGNDLYVTAVLLKNTLHQWLKLNPTLLCGNWKTASFFPERTLHPNGAKHNRDTSTLFVVSTVPFSAAIQHCLAPS